MYKRNLKKSKKKYRTIVERVKIFVPQFLFRMKILIDRYDIVYKRYKVIKLIYKLIKNI